MEAGTQLLGEKINEEETESLVEKKKKILMLLLLMYLRKHLNG